MLDTKLTLREPFIGEMMGDHSIFAGVSPHTNQPFFTTQFFYGDVVSWAAAHRAAFGMEAHGRNDWRVPTLDELLMMYDNRHKIGGFRDEDPYWAAAPHYMQSAWTINFKYGQINMAHKTSRYVIRCVRGLDPFRQ